MVEKIERGGISLHGEYIPGEDFPPANETFLAIASTDFTSTDFELLILSDDPRRARRIASSTVARILSLGPFEDVHVNLFPLTPQEFIDEARRQIDSGRKLPLRITRFGGLEKYQEERLLRNHNGDEQA